jgi:hypothetical protein
MLHRLPVVDQAVVPVVELGYWVLKSVKYEFIAIAGLEPNSKNKGTTNSTNTPALCFSVLICPPPIQCTAKNDNGLNDTGSAEGPNGSRVMRLPRWRRLESQSTELDVGFPNRS